MTDAQTTAIVAAILLGERSAADESALDKTLQLAAKIVQRAQVFTSPVR